MTHMAKKGSKVTHTPREGARASKGAPSAKASGKAEKTASRKKSDGGKGAEKAIGDPKSRPAPHLIPEDRRRLDASVYAPKGLSNVPANETPPPSQLDPEGWAERVSQEREEAKKYSAKRNKVLAAREVDEEVAALPPRAPRTSRDRAILEGQPYDNSQPGDFRDSSQKRGSVEERYVRTPVTLGGRKLGEVDGEPEIAPGKTAQQADDLQRPKASTASVEASEEEDKEQKGE